MTPHARRLLFAIGRSRSEYTTRLHSADGNPFEVRSLHACILPLKPPVQPYCCCYVFSAFICGYCGELSVKWTSPIQHAYAALTATQATPTTGLQAVFSKLLVAPHHNPSSSCLGGSVRGYTSRSPLTIGMRLLPSHWLFTFTYLLYPHDIYFLCQLLQRSSHWKFEHTNNLLNPLEYGPSIAASSTWSNLVSAVFVSQFVYVIIARRFCFPTVLVAARLESTFPLLQLTCLQEVFCCKYN